MNSLTEKIIHISTEIVCLIAIVTIIFNIRSKMKDAIFEDRERIQTLEKKVKELESKVKEQEEKNNQFIEMFSLLMSGRPSDIDTSRDIMNKVKYSNQSGTTDEDEDEEVGDITGIRQIPVKNVKSKSIQQLQPQPIQQLQPQPIQQLQQQPQPIQQLQQLQQPQQTQQPQQLKQTQPIQQLQQPQQTQQTRQLQPIQQPQQTQQPQQPQQLKQPPYNSVDAFVMLDGASLLMGLSENKKTTVLPPVIEEIVDEVDLDEELKEEIEALENDI